MFHEIERLTREAHLETQMSTEIFVCPRCHRSRKMTADEGKPVEVVCRTCGAKVTVVIEPRRDSREAA